MGLSLKELRSHLGGAFTAEEIEAYGEGGVVFTIKEYAIAEVGGEEKEVKPVVRFNETSKFVVVNKTRSNQLGELFGTDGNADGKKIRVFADNVKVGNRRHFMICFGAPE